MSCHRSQAACLLMCSMAPISDQLSSRALVRWHSHQLGGAVGKTADEVDVSERLQGLVPVVGVPGTAVGLSLCHFGDSMPGVCPAGALYLYPPREDNLTRPTSLTSTENRCTPIPHPAQHWKTAWIRRGDGQGGPGHGGPRSAISLASAAAAVISAVM